MGPKVILALAAMLLALAACQSCKSKSAGVAADTPVARAEIHGDDDRVIAFSMEAMTGETLLASEEFARHDVTIVDFWASWCGPCRREMPSLVRLYGEYRDRGLGIIGVSLDESRPDWVGAVEQMGMDWPQVSDLKGWGNEVAVRYGVRSIPFTAVVDRKGRLLASGLRGEELEAYISGLLD